MFCGKIVQDARREEFLRKKDYFKSEMKSRLLNPLEEIIENGQQIIEGLKETHDAYYHNMEKFIVFAAKVHGLLMPLIHAKEDAWIETEINHYRLHISRSTGVQNSFSFGMKCLVPWLTFNGIQKSAPRSIILTSGTLKPLDMW